MKKNLFLLLFCFTIIVSCVRKDDFNFSNLKISNWTPDWAFLLLNAHLLFSNFVKAGDVINIDSNGLYSLKYSSSPYSIKASDYIKIPDQNFNTGNFTLTSPITNASFTGSISDSLSNHFSYTDTSGAQLQHIVLKAGILQLNITSTYNQNISFIITFPNIKNGSNSLSVSSTISYPATTVSNNVDLSGYTIDMTNGGTAHNYIAYKINYTITGSGQPINATNTLSATIGYTNLQFSFVDGTMGHYTIPIPNDSIDLNIFNKTITASIYLQNPLLHLNFINSFGMGVTAQIDSLYGISTSGSIINMSLPVMSILGATTLGTTAISNYTIDSTNNTFRNILNPSPNKLVYRGRVLINPGGGTAYNFISDTSSIKLTVDAELSAWLKIINFSLQDTTKLILPQDTNILTKAQFAIQVINAFPLYASVQFYFADSNYTILDSLIKPNNNIIPQAPVDNNGIVNGTNTSTTYFIMNHDQYNVMANKVRYGFTRGNLYSSGSGAVQIHNKDNVSLKLAVRFSLNVSTNGL